MIFASGSIPLDPKSMQVVSGGIKEQTVSGVHVGGSGRQ
jgi:enamine deaminase RidA (YjgF/YER057c/UK114 family)